MDKGMLLDRLGATGDERLLLARILDRAQQAQSRNIPAYTDFLSPQQQMLARDLLSLAGIREDGFLFLGGYEGAERKVILFLPDWMDETMAESPIRCLRAAFRAEEGLSHRDFLGSLMGMGIVREKLGDILVKPDGAQAVVVRELGDYLMAHYGKAGRVSLDVKVSPISVIDTAISRRETVKFTVSSPRLDNVVSGVFHVSRKDAQEAVSRGMVFVNETEATKPDMQLKGGEKLVLRGKGKAIYQGVDGTSKKGKYYVTLEKFI